MAKSRYDRDEAVSPPSDAYTGMLAVSLVAMVLGCVFLWLDFSSYGNTKAPPVSIPPARTAGTPIGGAPAGQ